MEQPLNPVKSPLVKSRAEAWKAWQAANLITPKKIKLSAWKKDFQAILKGSEHWLELYTYNVRPNRGEIQVQLRSGEKAWIKIVGKQWYQWARPREWLIKEEFPFYIHRQEILLDEFTQFNDYEYGGDYLRYIMTERQYKFETDPSYLWKMLADAELKAYMQRKETQPIYIREFLKSLPEDLVPPKPEGWVAPEDILRKSEELNIRPDLVKVYGFLAENLREEEHKQETNHQGVEPMGTQDDSFNDEHEKVITRLIETYETFTGERISRGRANDLLTAMEINGLEIKLIED